MIGKAGAQNFLTFWQKNKFDNTSLTKKLELLFIITAAFRIGSLAIIVARGIYYAAIVHWPSALFIPFLVILIARLFAMKDLTLGKASKKKKKAKTWDIVPTGGRGSDTLNLVSQPP